MAVLTGERSRRYLPSIRFLELEEQRSKERFQVEIESADDCFAIDIPPGTYRLTRVQISEGPFMSMADLIMTFSVAPGAVTYAGTWRFGVDSPRYGRLVVVSMIANEEERGRIREFLHKQYPNIQESVMVEGLPEPSQVEARLYEVMPYPRVPRYFRRHWW